MTLPKLTPQEKTDARTRGKADIRFYIRNVLRGKRDDLAQALKETEETRDIVAEYGDTTGTLRYYLDSVEFLRGSLSLVEAELKRLERHE